VLFDDGHIVTKGDRMAEWDPFTMPVITEKKGIVRIPGPDRGQDADRAESTKRPASPSASSSNIAAARRRRICVRA
jgi:hypothetical protein